MESEKRHDFYKGNSQFYVSVDCIIFGLNEGALKLLLIKRDFEPCKGEWSLMGGFVNPDESVDCAAQRVLKKLTGLEGVYMHQIGTFGEVQRDPGERVVSVAYSAMLNFPEVDHEVLNRYNASWVDFDNIPELCLDHTEMVNKAISKIKSKFKSEPLAFRLLPERFTLTQLQQLYETVCGEKMDKRNFRRRALENKCIQDSGLLDKENSRRGARLYEYVNMDEDSFKM